MDFHDLAHDGEPQTRAVNVEPELSGGQPVAEVVLMKGDAVKKAAEKL
jgi:hypothetical protein